MLSSYLQELKKKSGRGRTMERLSDEDVDRIAIAVVEKAREDVDIRDVIIGSAMGEGAIPVYGRETRKEVCHACRIDPSKPLEAGNVMATTGNAFGILSQEEVRNWCSEIIEVADGRCARARSIREAARECKEKYPEDTEAFFRCYIPAFSQATKESNPTTRICPVCRGLISPDDYFVLERPERNIYLCTKGHLEQYALAQGERAAERRGYKGEEKARFAKGWAKTVTEEAKHIVKGEQI